MPQPDTRLRRVLPAVLAALLAACLAGAAFLAYDWWRRLPEGQTSDYVGRQVCAECHRKQLDDWTGSDHDLAMDPPTPEFVHGDFNNAQYKNPHTGVVSRMFRREGKYYANTDGPDGKMHDYEVKYTFGYRPLQQYLIEFPGGWLQCLPLAWDTQDKRWFHLYPDEPIPHSDELHWTKPLQNWNYMCADCHSTNLQRNYDLKTNRYHTTFSEIDVSCETCHGPSGLHAKIARSRRVFWDRRYGYGLPRLKVEDNRVEIETCAPCHARRRIVYPGFQAGGKFLDHYLPELLDGELYYADGQIRDEDYEYGSFIQSKMYHKNVRCTNCHDAHSMRVKFKDGPAINDNRLCGQCHVPAKYDAVSHHHHPDATKPGWLCIDCHMPKTKYMVVDPRLDHSIRIPRPELTVSLGIPNACTGCHHDAAKQETPQWAVDQVRQWYGPKQEPPHFAHAIAAGRKGDPAGQSLLDAVVRRKDLSAMVRASALVLLSRYGEAAIEVPAGEALRDPEALVRAAAVRSLQAFPPDRLQRHLTPLLHDPIRAVRTEAARTLAVVPERDMSVDDRQAFHKALDEYIQGQNSVSEQPAAHLNLAVIWTAQQKPKEAEAAYRTALRLDPRFIPARVNLAMLLDRLDRKAEAADQFREALKVNAGFAEAHYSLALLLAEDETKLPEAVEHLKRAADLMPQNARVYYNLGLALQKLKRFDEAASALKRSAKLSPDPTDAVYALALLYAQQEEWSEALANAEYLVGRHPGDAHFTSFRDGIRKRLSGK